MANTNTILPGYFQPLGSKLVGVVDHTGPANYQAGGENFNASDIGLGGIDHISGAAQSWNANNTGNFYVNVFIPVKKQGGAVSTVKLKWFNANGVEASNASNLTTEYVRLKIVGV